MRLAPGRRSSIVLCACALGVSLSLAASLAGAANTSLFPVADSYVVADSAVQNFGSARTLKLDGSPITNGYLRFDVDVPAGERVAHAALRLYSRSSSTSGLTAHVVADDAWDEHTISYANAPTLGATVASSGPYSSDSYVTLDVTGLVRDGSVSIGLKRKSTAANSFNSREALSNPPELVVETVPSDDVEPPDTFISRTPAEPTNDTTPTFEFSSTEPGTFVCRIDDGPFGPCVSPHTAASLPDGSHTFEVRAVDSAGNEDPSSASYAFAVDTHAPARPTAVAATGGEAEVRLDWDDGSEADLDHYEVSRGTVAGGPYTSIARTTASSHVDTSVIDGNAYYYVVEAVDRAGNRSVLSDEVAATPAGDPPPPPADPSVRPPVVPSLGAYFGSYVSTTTGRTVATTEAILGRSLQIVHDYRRWDHSPFLRAEHKSWAEGGRIVLLNWSAGKRDGSKVPWADIASGAHDARIDAVAEEAKLLGRPMFIAFHHEPEDEVGSLGSAADYARAFRRIVQRFTQSGVQNVAWVWNVMGASKYYSQYARDLYPGDDAVDWIGWDPYNWVDCNKRSGSWVEFADKVEVFYDWLRANGHDDKPFMLSEYGSDEPLAGQPDKGSWFLRARDAMTGAASDGKSAFPNLKALVYFDADRRAETGCAWHVDSSESSLAGFREMGADPYFKPSGAG